ncbi:MAG: N-6 DNA methylase [Lentisphaeria bacterium]|nr:N-6 DNA methylase [Lentisphaeria bacterium]
MADLFKPLFNPNLLRGRFTHFSPSLTEDQREVVANWSRTAADPAFQAEKEKPFQGQFLTDVFGRLLGYVLPVGHLEAYNLKAESASTETKGGKTPDARLGFIGYTRDVTRGVIELKPPAADLDARQPNHGNLTPVEQAFGYLAKFDDCRWVIVSNFVTLRLYSKRRGQGYAHVFRMADLADPETLRLFVFLLGRERLLAEPPGRSFLDALLEDSTDREEQLTRDFYALFSEVRLQLFHALRDANPPPGGSIPAEHEAFLLAMAQKILDRILFICFCEDTGLLPHGVIGQAFGAAGAGFVATTRWQQLRGLFEAVDRGHPPLRIHGYNGGLFRADPALDALAAPDDVLDGCLRLSGYDFATDVNVNILGHIFEQSITDLEAIRAEIAGRKPDKATGKRKREGVFYTPETITRYIVAETLGTWLRGRFEALQARHDPENVRGSARRQAARIALWRDYQEVLRNLRVLDPACGSGAFLVAAFDYLHAEYIRANDRLAALRGGQPELFDLDREILTRNLHGVDISPESVEITKLSLWLKTARPGKPLNDLDAHVRCGNSLVSPHPDLPPELAERAFDWRTAFPEVTAAGGFDCVIGNPPYIRQEWLSPCKATFQREFRCYAGTADAYLYFIERGLGLLRPGGMLGFITSGTFVNANFAAPFRAWLPTVARFHRVVNFGENQPFEDAEMVFPTISILVKETTPVPYRTYFMRGGIPDSIPEAVAAEGLDCDETVFARAEWRFQPRAVSELFDRLMAVGRPLGEAVGGRIYYGVKTGLNEAFLVNRATRDALVAADPDCAPILRKVLRGEDLRPWYYRDEDRWLIVMPSGFTREAGAPVAEPEAWNWLMSRHPAIADHLAPFAGAAARRSDKGEFWWELRPCAYYPAFDEPKILWPDIAKLPRFSWDTERVYVNDKGFIIAMKPDGAWLVAMLQSRIQWFAISQMCVPLRLRAGLWQSQCKKQFVERLRIPDTDPDTRSRLAELALEATAAARERYTLHEQVRRRIRADLGGGRPLNTALGEWWELDFFAFRRQLDKAFQARIPVAERDDWERTLAGWKADHAALTARLVTIEDEINDRVYALFGLSRADIALLEDHARHAMIAYSYGAP